MKYRSHPFFCILLLLWCTLPGISQDPPALEDGHPLFSTSEPLTLKMQYSTKKIRKQTNDSTYLRSFIYIGNSGWDTIPVKIRARGKYRRDNCYFIPLKLKISKKASQGTIFEGNRRLKLVLPCLIEKNKNDYVLKEYLAYSIFEIISPYYFNTRLANIDFLEEKGGRTIEHHLVGFLIEDSDRIEERYNAKEVNREVHPLQQDPLNAIRNDLFQFMIGNTDYSTKGGHNQKLFYMDGKYISLPYDFDMSGLVNASYATVSGMQNSSKSITEVTQRAYKGYKRDRTLVDQVRKEYLIKKEEIFRKLLKLKSDFQDEQQYEAAWKFLTAFYNILESDTRFEKQIIKNARDH